jgi:hypothetical protein
VIVNDFGEFNVDARLVVGQVDEVTAISGGCLCCLPDHGDLDDALERLAHPQLRPDSVLVESSDVADAWRAGPSDPLPRSHAATLAGRTLVPSFAAAVSLGASSASSP